LGLHFADKIKGMIIESGFASVTRLITHLGLPARGIDLKLIEEERRSALANTTIPALVIHGERDNLVPFQEAKDLFAGLGSRRKKLVIIPNADHNSLLFHGMETYFASIHEFMESRS